MSRRRLGDGIRTVLLTVTLAACLPEAPGPVGDGADDGGDPTDPQPSDTGRIDDGDGDGVPAPADCDDDDATVFPGAPERCDGVDQDCDDSLADESGVVTWWADPSRVGATVEDWTDDVGAATAAEPLARTLSGGELWLCPGTHHLALQVTGDGASVRGVGGRERVVVDGGGVARPLTVTARDVAVRALTLAHGSASRGGGLLAEDAGVTLTDVVVRDSAATVRGGGVAVTDTDLVLADVVLSDNTTEGAGGGLYVGGDGTLDVDGLSTSGNHAGTLGGGLRLSLDPGVPIPGSIRDLTSTDDHATLGGGAVSVAGGEDLQIGPLTITGAHTDGDGGAIHAQDGDVELDGTFEDVAATGHGGVLALRGAQAQVLLRGGISGASAGGRGGAVDGVGGVVTLRDLTAEQTASGGVGGVVAMQGGQVIGLTVTLTGPVAQASGGAVYVEDGELVLDDVVVTGARAEGPDAAGGVVRIQGGEAVLTDVEATDSQAVGLGGALYAAGAELTLSGVVLQDSVAGAGGGAMRLLDGDTTLTDVDLTGGQAQVEGGLLAVDGGALEVDGGTWSQGVLLASAQSFGGVAALRDVDASLVGTILRDGQATSGAGLYLRGGTTDLLDVVLEDHVSALHGGAVHLYDGTLALTTSSVVGNVAADAGGGLYVRPGGVVTLDEVLLMGNSPDSVWSGASVTEVGVLSGICTGGSGCALTP